MHVFDAVAFWNGMGEGLGFVQKEKKKGEYLPIISVRPLAAASHVHLNLLMLVLSMFNVLWDGDPFYYHNYNAGIKWSKKDGPLGRTNAKHNIIVDISFQKMSY